MVSRFNRGFYINGSIRENQLLRGCCYYAETVLHRWCSRDSADLLILLQPSGGNTQKLKIIKTSLDVLINRNMIFPVIEISYSTDKKENCKGELYMYKDNNKAAAKAALQRKM